MTQTPTDDLARHLARVRTALSDLAEEVRRTVGEVNDPRTQALLETTAEVLGGLTNAYAHRQAGEEPAWRSG